MSANGCQHLQIFKKDQNNKKAFKWIHAVFVVETRSKFRRARIINSYCRICKRRGPYLHACLECVFFGCLKHIREHVRNHKHTFSIDLIYGQIHCNLCGDYVYDNEMEALMRENLMESETFCKRLFGSTCWNLTQEERRFLNTGTKKMCISSESTIGLRGLVNLGNTCFMNCVIQALMHTPLLRDYFLTVSHKCNGKPSTCAICIISNIFQEFYKGEIAPLALDQYFCLIRSVRKDLADYKQHDAHELFTVTLDILHHQCLKLLPPPKSLETTPNIKCPCIIDQIFTGGLQRDVICQNCSGVSTAVDPISHFSLDLNPSNIGNEQPTLMDCLEHYTRVEYLGKDNQILCSNCQSVQLSSIQLTIKQLPIVANFQLNRFQYSTEDETLKKISTSISFPEMLDMTPFVGRSSIKQDNRYTLYAVINHLGTYGDGGHYIAYVRQQQDTWYKCDDHLITTANLQEVLESEGYILFYHKHVLNYE